MDKITTLNTLKNVFSALGAKTSDDNYGVALLDKTTAEPKGLMEMSDLASVLDAQFTYLDGNTDLNTVTTTGKYLLPGTAYTNAYTTSAIRGTLEVINTGTSVIQRVTEAYPSVAVHERGRWNLNWTEWN